MQKRNLGNSNLEVPALGLGCMGMSQSYGPVPERQELIVLIHGAVERAASQITVQGARYPEVLERLSYP